jgi:hypothetical protein
VFACCVEQLDEAEDRIGAHTIQRSLALLTARPTLSRRLGPKVNRPSAPGHPPTRQFRVGWAFGTIRFDVT